MTSLLPAPEAGCRPGVTNRANEPLGARSRGTHPTGTANGHGRKR
jgi:hypothetical protein